MKFIFGLAVTLLLYAGGSTSARVGENLLADPGFEATENSPWIYNDWWIGDQGQKNEVEFVRDPVRPRSGTACLRMGLKTKRGGNLQLTYSLANMLEGGTALQVCFWVRGPSNSNPLILLFDKNAPPWTEYYRASIPFAEDWREHVFNLTLPGNIGTKDLRLQFLLEEENTFWLDDVALCRLPEKEEGTPLPGNRVAHGSFETGRNRWYASFQESGRTPTIPRAVEQNIHAVLKAVTASDAPAGRNVLRCGFKPGASMHLTSALFSLRYGWPVDISFFARCPGGKGKLRAALEHGEFPNITSLGEEFGEIGADWKRFRFQATPSAATGGKYYLRFTSYTPGVYELDDIQVREPDAPEARPDIELGGRPADDSHPGNIFYREETVAFDLSAHAPGKTGKLHLRARVIDVWEKEIARMPIEIALDREGYGSYRLMWPAQKYGAFKCECCATAHDADGDAPLLLELVYHVVPKLTPLKEIGDSYFGGHFDMTPYNLSIAEKGGYRWLRLHPPMNTKWEVVEKRPGVFRFDLNGVKRAHAMGFKILGSFQATPDFYADVPKGKQNDWWDNWAPKEKHMGAYGRYVSKTARAFKDYIQAWEIWNEPDICFFNVPPGRDRTKAYLEVCAQTQKAMGEAGMEDRLLIGGAVTDNDVPFTTEILEQGIGKGVDVFSFHHYRSDSDALIHRKARIETWRAFKNRNGKVLPIWQTESGIFTGAGATWLRTSGRIPEPGHEMNVAAARTVQNLVFYKAIGVEKFFTYPLRAHPAGRTISRNSWESVIDVDGIPYAPLPAHAAAVYFLERTDPAGMEIAEVGDIRVFIASFIKQDRPITVTWSSRLIAMDQVKVLQTQGRPIFDMMGNAADNHPTLTREPLYFLHP